MTVHNLNDDLMKVVEYDDCPTATLPLQESTVKTKRKQSNQLKESVEDINT